MSKYDVAFIIPFLNESDNIERLVGTLEEVFQSVQEKIQVIFVDDGSSDNSVELLRASDPSSYSRKIVKLSQNYGSHAAIRAGLTESEAAYSTFLAADLQEDPLKVIEYYRYCKSKELDILMLYRESFTNTILGNVLSTGYVKLLKMLVSKDFPEKNIINFLVNEKVRKVLNNNAIRNSSIFLQIYFMGFKKELQPFPQTTRQSGKSKWTASMKMKLLVDSLVSFSYVPLRIITVIGFLLFFLGLFYFGIVLVSAIASDEVQSGWPTLMSIVLMGFGFTNISLGVISEYMWRIFDNTKNTPVFLIDETYE